MLTLRISRWHILEKVSRAGMTGSETPSSCPALSHTGASGMSNNQFITIGAYNGTPIHIRQSDRYYNATEMCKANGVLWGDYWRRKETQELVAYLASDMGIPISQLVISVKGNRRDGTKQGTWVHRDVAWDLATWISVPFRVWLIRQGQAIEDGRQVAHREYAELTAEQHLGRYLAYVNGRLEDHSERLDYHEHDIATLFHLASKPKKKPQRHEAEVRDRWSKKWPDAIIEHQTKFCRIDIYVPATWVIEVKRENEWSGARGQVLQAQRYDRDASKMLVLFTARNRIPYSPAKRLQIARELNDESVVVYWDDEPEKNYNAIVDNRGRNLILPLI